MAILWKHFRESNKVKIKYFGWLIFIIILYFYLNLFKDALIDDAFITLCYVRNIIQSGTWGFFPGYVTNTATSPLNVLLLTIISFFSGPSTEAPIILALICIVVMAIMLTKVSKELFKTGIFGYLATLTIVLNPLIISTLGLEGILFIALLTASIYCYIFKSWYLLAIVLGLLTITRAEGILYFGIFLLFVPMKKYRFAGIYLLSIAPWYIFSWAYLGSFIPDTFFIKTAQASWQGWTFFNGIILYYEKYPLETILSFAFLPLLLFLFMKIIRRVKVIFIILLVGLVHFLGYASLHVAPYHWYYVPEITTIILVGSFSLGIVYQRYYSNFRLRKCIHGVILVFFLIPSIGMIQILAKDHFSINEMPINTNWATQDQYKILGTWLKNNTFDKVILLNQGEVGTTAYYCDCYILDVFSDRRWLRDSVEKIREGNGIQSIILNINFYFFPTNQREFPPYSYRLSQYSNRGDPGIFLKKWETSTKWVPQGLITFANY